MIGRSPSMLALLAAVAKIDGAAAAVVDALPRSPLVQAFACLGVFASTFAFALLIGLEPLDGSLGGVVLTFLFSGELPVAGRGVGPRIPPPADHGYEPNGGKALTESSAAWRSNSCLDDSKSETSPELARAGELVGTPGRGKDNHDHRSDPRSAGAPAG